MEVTNHDEPASALQSKAAKLHQNPDLAMPSSKKLKRSSKSRKQSIPELQQREEEEEAGGGGDDTADRAEVESKIVALQRIVPGGEDLGVDKLFEETAEYILSLQCQVKAMRALTSFFEGLERNKRKLGG